jgi:hypothetical protein
MASKFTSVEVLRSPAAILSVTLGHARLQELRQMEELIRSDGRIGGPRAEELLGVVRTTLDWKGNYEGIINAFLTRAASSKWLSDDARSHGQ